LTTAVGRWGAIRAALEDRKALRLLSIGAFFGPFVGVTLSLVAIQATETGVAATIMATSPVLILPFAVWVEKERIRVGGYGGALLATAGVALLFLR
jgi:drug/metabolite transporter (DMT)-like permease